jgi:gliding motility-associated-like protein
MLICEGDSALFYVTGQSGSTFLWQNGSTDSVTWYGTPGPFWLQVTNSCGTSADTGLVILKPDPGNTQLPNVFTPNGDGINDTYFVAAMNGVDAYHLYIYNRWGRLLFDSGDYTEAWTGEGDNGIAPGGTYFVIATYQDCKGEAQQKNGTVQVIGDQP